MNDLRSAFLWLNDPLNWTGPSGVFSLAGEHLAMTVVAVLLATLVALPLGVLLGHGAHAPGTTHSGRARRSAGPGAGATTVVIANVSRALPTFALLTIFATTGLGFGNRPTVLAAAIFALPVILANAYAGIVEVDADVRDAARGMGLSGRRVLLGVELPLAMPLIATGLRSATVQVVATIPLAALVGGGGLGRIVVEGFGTQRYGQVIAGGFLVAVLCLLVEGVLAAGQRLVTPPQMRVTAAARREST
ncbi:ABC transporter permease [Sanguibacter antarcticus]|uniref:Osmoprotectant transport system permease protein n=1 Tax=Sanguibacter antarcticus TaxID=372484 RepID=A0A2A9E910_9MICO|nr:ABC transporter permease [Sanguibacter antarcticus]PFG34660.1 osmoprotectant transport system permease protein [Sanguibacter antarcticus]